MSEELLVKSNGQWQLNKAASDPSTLKPGSHEVEIHPDMDHLYNIKGMIKESGKDHLKIGHLRQRGVDEGTLKKLPRDSTGKVTAEGIDKHIESLPKHKVRLDVGKYNMGMQQHNENPQMAISVHMADDHYDSMKPDTKNLHDNIHSMQHDVHENGNTHRQVGWGRVDATKPGHWHIDEIQSDFQNKNKVKDHAWLTEAEHAHDFMQNNPDHPLTQKYWDPDVMEGNAYGSDMWELMDSPTIRNEFRQATGNKGVVDDNTIKDYVQHISHGHEDPQHMIHSALNALARKHDIGSISMDTPVDQARQSGISHPDDNPLKSAMDKLGGHDNVAQTISHGLTNWHRDESERAIHEALDEDNPAYRDLSDKESEALSSYISHHAYNAPEIPDNAQWSEELQDKHGKNIDNYIKQMSDNYSKNIDEGRDVPVHQKLTYEKRPKKLGMRNVSKDHFYEDAEPDQDVQWMKLHKSLLKIKELLKKTRS